MVLECENNKGYGAAQMAIAKTSLKAAVNAERGPFGFKNVWTRESRLK